MLKRSSGLVFVAAFVAVSLTGCFRQASPDMNSPAGNYVTKPPLTAPSGDEVSPTSFITPFVPGQGPDITSMPTLGSPEPTLPLVEAGSEETTAAPTQALLSSPAPLETPSGRPTIPFAAGPTYTPVPGAPPVDLNPSAPTPTVLQPVATLDNCVHTVLAGETAFQIAALYDVTLTQLIEYNDMTNADVLSEGQQLRIPGCGQTVTGTPMIQPPGVTATAQPSRTTDDGTIIHTVQAGQNLFRIALSYGVTMQAIVDANGLANENVILNVGQELIIPAP